MRTATKVAVVAALTVSLAGCTGSSSGGTSGGTSTATSPQPLGTHATGSLLCGLIPSAAVERATGRTRYDTYGQTLHNPGKSDYVGTCTVVDRSTRDTLVAANIRSSDAGFGDKVRSEAAAHSREYTFPAALGIGTAQHEGYLAHSGKQLRGGQASLLRGDRVINLEIDLAAPGRDPMPDAVALTLQIANALDLPAGPSPTDPTPTDPTPTGSSTAG